MKVHDKGCRAYPSGTKMDDRIREWCTRNMHKDMCTYHRKGELYICQHFPIKDGPERSIYQIEKQGELDARESDKGETR